MKKEQQTAQLERHLQTALSGSVQTIASPPEMDAGIERLFDQYAIRRQKQTRDRKRTYAARIRKPRGRYYQWQMAALLVIGITVLGSGTYAANMAYSITTGKSILSYTVSDIKPVTPEQSAEIQQIISEVRSQLSAGQSAYVYSSKFEALPHMGSTIVVNQPHKFSTVDSWYPAIQPTTGPVPTPQYVPDGYQFAYGLDEYYMSDAHVNEKKKQVQMIMNLLEDKAAHPLQGYAWTLVPPEDETNRFLQVPMLIYTSSTGKSIQLSYLTMRGSANNKLEIEDANNTSVSIVNSKKGKMFYSTAPNGYLEFSAKQELGLLRSLNWAAKPDDQGRVLTTFTLTTDDTSISKQDMIRMAESLQ
ncbi:hypothetical protein [Paenibacillus wulumuqiensis]|uniref:hypothetical protein n=1 Tax=Paenibacillus wulumuqiensis TaxID=1567107 RepID=UPI0006194E88|nr:hypothetical protein [Paenibacillus wulumuqiensis]